MVSYFDDALHNCENVVAAVLLSY